MSLETNIHVPVEALQVISADQAHHYGIIPKAITATSSVFYIDTAKFTEEVTDELELILGTTVTLEQLDSDSINKALFVYYRKSREGEQSANISLTNKHFVEDLILEAKVIGSSDIHFEVFEDEARVRLRIDGVLVEKYRIPKENYLELVNKIKIDANLDITEKRLPQDGRINFPDFDIRVSILPTLHGEKIVMRILGKDASNISLDNLGLSAEEKSIYLEAVKKSNGIVLISGPTGSGKTTTLYATLRLLNDIKSNIVTVEDPIEYTLKGINQVQLKENIGLTFSSALRSFLRQDPDIIMLGEIRDAETAKMAIRASLTGHLVLSTIHTNSALGTISRLVDMGVPAFYIAETLNLSVAQRLLRLLCDDCKVKQPLNETELPRNYKPEVPLHEHYVATGCEKCYYTGYRGRTAIYEMIPVTHELSQLIKEDINKIITYKSTHYTPLASKAFELLRQGKTSLEEVYPMLITS